MVEMVESVTYYANTAFVEAVYDSCKDVVNPAIGPVMNFLCGRWGAEHQDEGCSCDQCSAACHECLFVNVCDNHDKFEEVKKALSKYEI